jgi:hypothetical protein
MSYLVARVRGVVRSDVVERTASRECTARFESVLLDQAPHLLFELLAHLDQRYARSNYVLLHPLTHLAMYLCCATQVTEHICGHFVQFNFLARCAAPRLLRVFLYLTEGIVAVRIELGDGYRGQISRHHHRRLGRHHCARVRICCICVRSIYQYCAKWSQQYLSSSTRDSRVTCRFVLCIRVVFSCGIGCLLLFLLFLLLSGLLAHD